MGGKISRRTQDLLRAVLYSSEILWFVRQYVIQDIQSWSSPTLIISAIFAEISGSYCTMPCKLRSNPPVYRPALLKISCDIMIALQYYLHAWNWDTHFVTFFKFDLFPFIRKCQLWASSRTFPILGVVWKIHIGSFVFCNASYLFGLGWNYSFIRTHLSAIHKYDRPWDCPARCD